MFTSNGSGFLEGKQITAPSPTKTSIDRGELPQQLARPEMATFSSTPCPRQPLLWLCCFCNSSHSGEKFL